MADDDPLTAALLRMKAAVAAIHFAVPEDIATDVRNRWNELVAALRDAGVVDSAERGE